MIGPHRGGRTVAAVGVPGTPTTFYQGVNNGGVWRTTDYGRTWVPIFDSAPTGSVGSIAVAASDPNVIYVGSGEGLQRPDLSTGDGVYKTTDGGKTWTNTGLRDGQQVPAIIVDPADANRAFVAVLGHPYGANTERGIFRTTNGGRTWDRVLYKDENTGGMDLAFDPSNSQVIYSVLWSARQSPWESGSSVTLSANNGLYKSTDGGTSWRKLGEGLPSAADGLGRMGIEVARANPSRLYAIVGAQKNGGLYRSDDAGEHWTLVNNDERVWGRDGDFNEVRADSKNADVIYVANVVTWKSVDGGKTIQSFRGAPGGDDYHRLWLHPTDPKTILLTSDQGGVITQNGGESWSSWYNQPSAQFYHVSTDNAFPYRVCGGQQESGSACVQSRSDDGRITFANWHPVAAEEYGYAVPDPLNPDLVYGGKISRYDRRNGQVQDVSPKAFRDADYRLVRTAPIAFSPVDKRTLFFASNRVWSTRDGGEHWTIRSPDLTRASSAVPPNFGAFAALDPAKGVHHGVVYALAPSPLDINRIWAGTDDGLVQLTTDGGAHWRDVTPPALRDRPWSKVSIIDASHFDAHTAYVAVNTFRLDDLRPHLFATHDDGKTWTEIVNGIPAEGITNVIREDPVRRGLLYAGTERSVFVSLDDGAHWQSLRNNMPATSIRDLVIKDNDLVIATHGRSFWIMDDVSALRQLAAGMPTKPVHVFKPAVATRVRYSAWPDTPLPPDEPAGENPPDGAVIDYWLSSAATGPVTIEVRDGAGRMVRRYSSTDTVSVPRDTGNWPWYWQRPGQRVATSAGAHRLVWDLHFTAPKGDISYPISATPFNTPPDPKGPWVNPGTYSITVRTPSSEATTTLTVRMDPRVKSAPAAWAKQYALSLKAYDALARVNAVAGGTDAQKATRADVAGQLQALLDLFQGSELTPTSQAEAALGAVLAKVPKVLSP
ncbi:MAG: glycosyl hydrolase repeat-containing protein [Gemmatimonadetes bacterium]|nr:glycosyl hydrolase repeat-containing protein [Gemmatimonadota bacterium]